MKTVNVYLPFKGHTIYGHGTVWLNEEKNKPFKYVFIDDMGSKIFFNSVNEHQVRGMVLETSLTDDFLSNLK